MTSTLRRAALMAACAAAGLAVPLPSAHAAAPHVIAGFTYVTGSITPTPLDTVAPGEEIAFTNLDSVAHTVTFTGMDDVPGKDTDPFGGISSLGDVTRSVIAPTTSGTYTYYCTLHGAAIMSGTLVVA